MNVPKFGSFKPKVSISSSSDVGIRNTREKDSSRDDKSSLRDSERPDRRHRSRSRDKVSGARSELPSRGSEIPTSPFVIDKKGDEKNLVYGGLYRYDVAYYRRIGAGSVLGVKKALKIQRDMSDDKYMVLSTSHAKAHRSREKYVFSRMESPQLLKIRLEMSIQVDSTAESDFISLENQHGRKRRKLSHSVSDHSDADDEKKHYRSIQGKAKEGEPSDDDLEYAFDIDAVGLKAEDGMAILREQNIKLSRKVERNPHDIAAWVNLIKHQDSFLRAGAEHKRTTNAEIQSTAEIKIHMFEKALENATALQDKEILLGDLMAEGAKIWGINEQLRRWEQISQHNLESLSLWKQYLNFRQSAFTAFQYEEIRDLYSSRFELLQQSIPKAGVATAKLLTNQLVYVFLRYTLFCQESGHTELAVSLWQAILEINFRAPTSTVEFEWKSSFNDYWESEVARIGESGSTGWASYYASPDNNEELPARVDEASPNVSRKNAFQDWTIAERYMQKNSHYPARTLDETVEDDPFRVVLFTDIEDFLFILPESLDSHRRLLNAYLLFCHNAPLSNEMNGWCEDGFVVGASPGSSAKLSNVHESTGASDTRVISNILSLEARNYYPSSENYFSPFWYNQILHWGQDQVSGANRISYAWFRTTLHHVLDAAFTDDLAEYVLAFEWRNEAVTIKKYAKTLIKKHSNSIRLYNAYAMIEWTRGNKDFASGVFNAAVNMAKSLPDETSEDVILLWKSWVWCFLEEGDKDNAMKHLLCIADGTVNTTLQAGPTAIIRTRQHLTSKRDHLLGTNSPTNALIYAELVAILDYLTSTSQTQLQSNSQGSITAYLAEIASCSDNIISRNLSGISLHEILLQSSARLFFNHARTGPFQPALLRSTMQTYLTYYPTNSIFLSIFEWNEARFRIEGRVRSFLISQPKFTFSQHVFRIQHEVKVGTIHSVRAAFEHAVDVTSEAKSNAGVWKSFILFVAKNFPQMTKGVWYRALRACPWVKELYLVGFEVLGKEMDEVEMMGTWRILVEKGLRIHVDLEEIFEVM